MAKTTGSKSHPLFKLGKASPKADKRNFQFAVLLKAPPPTPAQFDFDLQHPGIPTPMFGNDVYGDCVIAARAHLTLRFEDIEQGSVLMITDKAVLREYFKESGGPDSGLVILDSLNEWRQQGWRPTTKPKTYKIHAYAQIDPSNHDEVKAGIFLLTAAYIGLALPNSAKAQIHTGQPWDVVSGPDAKPNSWGGHCVIIPGYNAKGPVCVTWGQKQQMTWAFFDKYCDEAYALVDEVNVKKGKKGIDVQKLMEYLNSLH